MRELDEITGAVIEASIQIHRDLGPGLLESVYEVVLARSLERRGFEVERQKPIRFEYDGMVFDEGFRTDLLVDCRVVVELKSVEKLPRPRQTTSNVHPPDESSRRTSHQFRR